MQATPGHAALISALRRAAYTENHALLFVHAGLDPGRPLERQADALWWGGPGFAELAYPYDGFRRVVRGFDPQHRGVEVQPYTTTLDAGCGFGGPLVAACFDPQGEILDSVEA
jgi:serine/threonine protein phosphatase 1